MNIDMRKQDILRELRDLTTTRAAVAQRMQAHNNLFISAAITNDAKGMDTYRALAHEDTDKMLDVASRILTLAKALSELSMQ